MGLLVIAAPWLQTGDNIHHKFSIINDMFNILTIHANIKRSDPFMFSVENSDIQHFKQAMYSIAN